MPRNWMTCLMMSNIKNLSGRKSLLIAGISYTIFITILFFTPVPEDSTMPDSGLDKLVHVLFHWLLATIWLIYFYLGDQSHFSSKMLILALVTCFFYGIVVEAFQQWFTETRTFDLLDIVANASGDLLGLLTFRLVRKKM